MVNIQTYTCLHMYMCTYVYIYICIYICVYVYLYIYIGGIRCGRVVAFPLQAYQGNIYRRILQTYIDLHLYIFTHACIHVCMYLYIYT